ncbi:MAG: hypothetical protein KAR11_07905 [Phycisphaerae bacterium]|nr:hypothetical protein [Phycisphaerae bacterium]
MESLEKELNAFREEKEKIRNIIGQIGGTESRRTDQILNIVFILFLIALIGVDIVRHFVGALSWVPQLFSLEIGVMLVSLKIIWMIHKQAKVEHFQFWILNSIEFRLNEISKHVNDIMKDREEDRER